MLWINFSLNPGTKRYTYIFSLIFSIFISSKIQNHLLHLLLWWAIFVPPLPTSENMCLPLNVFSIAIVNDINTLEWINNKVFFFSRSFSAFRVWKCNPIVFVETHNSFTHILFILIRGLLVNWPKWYFEWLSKVLHSHTVHETH